MIKLIFSKSQNELFTKQFELNKEDISVWRILNTIMPFVIIMIPSLLFAFLPEDKVSVENLILNGSFSLLGINVLFSMSNHLVTFLKNRDQKMEEQIRQLKTRLILYLCILLILGSIFYVAQIAFNINTMYRHWSVSIALVVILYLSYGIGKRIYAVKDELVGTAINDYIGNKVDDLKASVNDIK